MAALAMKKGDRNAPTRQDTWIIRVDFEGNDIGVWDKKTGGAIDSDDTKYYPGDMAKAIALGGRKTTDNVVLQRFYDRSDDHDQINFLLNGVGHAVVKIYQRPLDLDGNGYGKSITYIGKLKRVLVPEVDSEASGAAMLEIEITIDGYPSSG